MTFGLISWLKSKYTDLVYEFPLWYPSREQPDHREWLVTNGLGGYSSGTISGALTRRYHGLLVSALDAPHNRHVVLAGVDELLTLNGTVHQLATNHWASGVVSPTGYKLLESFTVQPSPTWVYEFNGNYLIKQLTLNHATNELQLGYTWLPYLDDQIDAKLSVRFLTGYRNFHEKLAGSSDDRYPQFVSPNHSVIILNDTGKRLCLTWNTGDYESHKQWWWDYHFPEETARGEPDKADLFFVGSVTTKLEFEKQFSIGASLDKPIEKPDCHAAVAKNLVRQRGMLKIANLPRTPAANMLVLATDQFLVSNSPDTTTAEEGVIEGYPWFAESGRAAMISMPGLTLATRKFEDGKRILRHYSSKMKNGILPNRYIEAPKTPVGFEYGAADVTLWWAWALYQYHKTTKDLEFVKEQLPLLFEAANHYIAGTNKEVRVDPIDGLLRCSSVQQEFTWMDTKVADFPITPRSGKAVEMCALWYNFCEVIVFFARTLGDTEHDVSELERLATLSKQSMQKFWNADSQCLFDVIEPSYGSSALPERSIRPNQLLAVSMPFRALTTAQEKAVLVAVESELLTPMGIRTLATTDPSYQSIYGCGFSHADQYHRDLSYHQGMAWPWLLGAYCDALINVFGLLPETTARINLVMQPLLTHLIDEAGLGSISEIFDGSRPHLPRGCIAQAWSVAEAMRFLSWQNRR